MRVSCYLAVRGTRRFTFLAGSFKANSQGQHGPQRKDRFCIRLEKSHSPKVKARVAPLLEFLRDFFALFLEWRGVGPLDLPSGDVGTLAALALRANHDGV